ncbi:50S ribosomal protein L17 [Candidatus Nomurabacteria bacterium RIFCSPLOWO2_01_FULL_41_21]|uniref:Large ribosomal subunit protein bL17 n=2 Tax=Candidatus Nomuraibacteriota TaxID=1752729 RepID=A0A1F6V2X8_9BACT|nr:MAG: 50S ribosomal protein L17 [Candidatus Nomurabacteria bacterium RIFCSPHIGHO2_01_FULL_40_20]OGI88721.1 MAG: 50S ribosomal protein L17 [Candidatus Nomurabacteria bacterium RIFCSPLOWO2_01_FULL_41_21]
MRHHNKNRKFGRDKNGRKALLNSLALNLIVRGKIKTTEQKAKELRPFIEGLVTRAKSNTMTNKRLVASTLFGRKSETKKLFETIAPKYINQNGGYTRVLKLGVRKSDSAKMAIIEFV